MSQLALELFKEVRCMSCDGQMLAESDAPLALEMKKFIEHRLAEGQTIAEIKMQLVNAYGQGVLQEPAHGMLLWYLPFILAAIILLWFGKKLLFK